jgi:hypothetical protein
MIGNAKGSMITTRDLELDQVVSVDHQDFQVVDFEALPEGVAVVLAPAYGSPWRLEIHENDIDEPMWEAV